MEKGKAIAKGRKKHREKTKTNWGGWETKPNQTQCMSSNSANNC